MRTLPRRWWLAVLALVVSVLAVPSASPASAADAFYTPPSTLPSANGAVIRSRSSLFTLDPLLKTAVPFVKAQQVLYKSTNATGQAIAVSGTVLVPTTPWIGLGSRPLITYAVGTRGLGDACAPSQTLTQGLDYEGLFIKGMLDRGWAVAVSDYEGLGTPGGHTYMVGPSQGRVVLDMARAAERLSGTGLSSTSPVGVFGYSQGGGAAAWAAELAPSYAPELKIKGVAAGGVPSDLISVANSDDGTLMAVLPLLAAAGFDNAYPELNLETYLNARGTDLMNRAMDFCLASFDGVKTLIDTAFTHRSDYVTVDPLTNATWQTRLNQSKLGKVKPTAPIYQWHGNVDEMVNYPQGKALRQAWCAKGANVTWSPQVGEHVTAMVSGYPGATSWLANRFAGLPAVSNCWLP